MHYIKLLRPIFTINLNPKCGFVVTIGMEFRWRVTNGTQVASIPIKAQQYEYRLDGDNRCDNQTRPPVHRSWRKRICRFPREEQHALTRKLLGELLISDADFDAFCLTYFHQIRHNFSSASDRVQRETMLLEREEPVIILTSLFKHKRKIFISAFFRLTRCRL